MVCLVMGENEKLSLASSSCMMCGTVVREPPSTWHQGSSLTIENGLVLAA